MTNRLLAIVRNTIPYAKELRQIPPETYPQIKSASTAILMQQLEYWFDKYPDGFYKFMSPCPDHEHYTEGDSWTEELGFNVSEFRTSFDSIGKRYTSKSAWRKANGSFEGMYYCSYYDKRQGVTWYYRNHELVDSALDFLVAQVKKSPKAPKIKPFPRDAEPHLQEMQNLISRDVVSESLEMQNSISLSIYTETTPEITPETTLSPLPPLAEGEPEERERTTSENQTFPAQPDVPDVPDNPDVPSPSPPVSTQPDLPVKPEAPHEDSIAGAANENDSNFQKVGELNEAESSRNCVSSVATLHASEPSLKEFPKQPRLGRNSESGDADGSRNVFRNEVERHKGAQVKGKSNETYTESNLLGNSDTGIIGTSSDRNSDTGGKPGRDRSARNTARSANGVANGGVTATAREIGLKYQRNQLEYPKNIDGSDRLPWETDKRGIFDPDFEKHMARSLMQYPAYRDLMAGELMTKVRKHISGGRYDLKRRDELLIEWEAMHCEDRDTPSSLTAKSALRRAKIRSALNTGD